MYLDATPDTHPTGSSSKCSLISSSLPHCNHLTQTSTNITIEDKKEDNLLQNLRQYYSEVKTKCQLNLGVPAGFRMSNTYQSQVRDFHLSNGNA